MAYDTLISAVGGSAIIAAVGTPFVQRALEKISNAAEKKFESAIKQSEETQKKLLEFTQGVDIDLRERRIVAYSELWLTTALLPKWPRAENITYEKLLEFSGSVRDWYFKGNGMYLSENAMHSYKELQNTIHKILSEKDSGLLEKTEDTDHYEIIRGCCSNLRSELTKDIVSRKASPL